MSSGSAFGFGFGAHPGLRTCVELGKMQRDATLSPGVRIVVTPANATSKPRMRESGGVWIVEGDGVAGADSSQDGAYRQWFWAMQDESSRLQHAAYLAEKNRLMMNSFHYAPTQPNVEAPRPDSFCAAVSAALKAFVRRKNVTT